jgi:gliding motility-associated peptidyl-prolyl isomerase
MKIVKNSFALLLLLITLISCKQQQARMPISRSSGEFLKESAERNKKLIKGEEAQIQEIIKGNPNVKYIASSKGYWYRYETKNDTDSLSPKKGDVAFFDYEIKDIKGTIIYSKLELKPQTYLVDKQDILMGLRDGIKFMHKNETVTFLFPSHMAFGYHGDENRIGTNEPIICTVTLNDFKPDTTPKKTQTKQIITPE